MSIALVIATAYGAALSLAAVSGNGVSPIRITTTIPHGYGTGDWVHVAGVVGNTAANVSDQATAIDALNFSVPGVGNGTWDGLSGSVALYYGFANGLAVYGHAPLINARIGVGPEYLAENNDTPRVTFVPTVMPFYGRPGFNSQNLAANGYNPALNTQSPLPYSRIVTGNVHCWGTDYDDAMFLCDQFLRSMSYVLTSGNFWTSPGKWTDSTRVAVRGRELVFPCSWVEASVDLPAPLAPAQTVGDATLYIDDAGNAVGTMPVVVND